MNYSCFLGLAAVIGFTQFTFAAEPSDVPDRKRPRKEVTRAEPPGKTEVQPDKGKADLCNENGDVKYSATWTKGTLTLAASGEHNTAGYKVRFEQSMLRIYPPQYILKHEKPDGVAAQAITPFSVQTTFKADEKPVEITVHDAKGKQQVPVK